MSNDGFKFHIVSITIYLQIKKSSVQNAFYFSFYFNDKLHFRFSWRLVV